MDYIYKNRYVYFTKEGSGESIILLHGWGVDSTTFKALIKLLQKAYLVYAIDLPGFGQSAEPLDSYNLDDYVTLLENFIIDKNITNPILIGHSFGGRIALKYASMHQVHKLILIDSAGLRSKDYFKVKMKVFLYKLKKHYYRITKNVMKYQNLISHSGSIDYQNASLAMKKTLSLVTKEALNPILKKIKCETLIIWGKLDQVTPLYMGQTFHRKIASSGLVVLDNVGHFPYLEDAFTFNKIISNYLGVK